MPAARRDTPPGARSNARRQQELEMVLHRWLEQQQGLQGRRQHIRDLLARSAIPGLSYFPCMDGPCATPIAN